jgi:predicted ribosomally synthesized peptide with nif11-like leader
MNMDLDRSELKTALASAGAFLLRFQEDGSFREKVESLTNDVDLMAFIRQEGFVFTLRELEEIIKAGMQDDPSGENLKSRVVRRAQRYQVYIKVSELNGEPVTDTMILDISAWGARIGSFSPFDAPGAIEITFTPPGEPNNVHISGEVVWSRLMPVDSQYHAGVEFSKSLNQLHREGEI